MELLYKPDWEKTKERMTTWWAHEDFGRCALAVTAPKSGIQHVDPPRLPEKKEDWWIDLDYLRAANEYRMSRTFYGGEAVPAWSTGDGWVNNACFVGCPVTLREDAGWVEPILADGELTDHDYHKLVIDPGNWWWQFSNKIHRFEVEHARGKSIPSIQTLGGCADTLAAIRGSQHLVYDVADCPNYVREFDQYLMKQWIEVHDRFYTITKDGAEGSTAWPGLNVWAPGRFYFSMCDFSYMISPKMFRNIFLPSIEMQVNYLEQCIYHLDGVDAFAHVDALLELPKLDGIQIVPGAGKPNALHYMDMLKKIQRAGKNLQILLPPEDVEAALENLSSKGLLITTNCNTEEEARILLKKAEKISKVRIV